jgi:L-lactate permease
VFNIYLIVVASVVGALSLVFLVILPLLAIWGEAEPVSALGSWYVEVFGDYFGAVLAGFGSVTLTFAILERVLPEDAFKETEEEKWDPRTLPQADDRTQVKIGELIFETVMIVIALIVFNFFPQWLGLNFVASVDDVPHKWYSIPLLADTFFTAYLPLLNVQWILNIGMNIVLLRQGRWQLATRLFDFGLAVFGVVICSRMLTGPAILNMDAITPESLKQLLESILPPMLKLALVLGLIGGIVEAARKLYRIIRDGVWKVNTT